MNGCDFAKNCLKSLKINENTFKTFIYPGMFSFFEKIKNALIY
jgi:hypothetical protein